ncbi:MAG: TolC family protein [Prevotella sp.]|nr:TolC family protein [Prevotella sp.]
MKKVLTICMLAASLLPAEAQQLLTLDSCRSMALRNNKQMGISKLKQDIAANTRKALRTKYLPKVSAIGGYEFVSKEISLLNSEQKSALNNLGSNLVGNITQQAPSMITNWVQQGLITMEQAQQLSQMFSQYAPTFGSHAANALDGIGQSITNAFRTDNRNMFAVSVMVRQPIYMGGAITAANKMADIAENMMAVSAESTLQNTLYNIDQAYWQVVSVRQKERLANSFLEVVKKLDGDVEKMIREGVATRADGLKVKVKVNEAEMNVTQAQDGLVLSKMLLCQLCGLPLDSDIKLADEDKNDIAIASTADDMNVQTAIENRPELKLLQNTVDIARQTTKLVRAAYLPHIALTGGYLATNPNVYDGYRNKFGGVWNIGVLVHVPIWNWFEGEYKVRATKAATSMANLELTEAQEKIELQVTQCKFKLREANKKLAMAAKNVEKAEENLRCANLGFHEGVLTATEVMEAQTAWVQALSQKIDAQTEVQLSQVGLKKALGILN